MLEKFEWGCYDGQKLDFDNVLYRHLVIMYAIGRGITTHEVMCPIKH